MSEELNLHRRNYRSHPQTDVIFGERPVAEAHQAKS